MATITTIEQRLEYNNISFQMFPKTHKYNMPYIYIYLNINDTTITFNDKCLLYREYIIEPFQAMVEDYYASLDVLFYIKNNTIRLGLSKPLDTSEYINLIEMFQDLLHTIDDVSITYEKTIINITQPSS